MKASRYLCRFIFGVVLATLAALFTHNALVTIVAGCGGTFLGGYVWDELAKNLVIKSRSGRTGGEV